MRPYRSSVRRRRGFTLFEQVVAAVLSTLLMSLLATALVAFGSTGAGGRGSRRIAQEGILAAQSIACDLGGFLPDAPGQTGTLAQYQFVDWNLSNSGVFLLNFQGANVGDVVVITYQLSGNPARPIQLIDWRIHNHLQLRDCLFRRPEPGQFQPGLDPDHDRLPLLLGNLYLHWCTSIMIGPTPTCLRRGYSLTVVFIFLILLFALWSVVYRTTSSRLRIETCRVLQQIRDQGAMNALAQAVQLLQYSTPSDSSNPGRTQYTYGVQVSVTSVSGTCTTADYTVVYTARPDLGPVRWEVQVSAGSYGVPLPSPGASPQWP